MTLSLELQFCGQHNVSGTTARSTSWAILSLLPQSNDKQSLVLASTILPYLQDKKIAEFVARQLLTISSRRDDPQAVAEVSALVQGTVNAL